MLLIRLDTFIDAVQQRLGGRCVALNRSATQAVSERDSDFDECDYDLRVHCFTSSKARIVFSRSRRLLLSCCRYVSAGVFVASAPRYVSQELRATLYA